MLLLEINFILSYLILYANSLCLNAIMSDMETKMDITSTTLELTAENLQYITLDQNSGIHYPTS